MSTTTTEVKCPRCGHRKENHASWNCGDANCCLGCWGEDIRCFCMATHEQIEEELKELAEKESSTDVPG